MADSKKEKTNENKDCNKIYKEAFTRRSAITHLSCHHGTVIGFTVTKHGVKL